MRAVMIKLLISGGQTGADRAGLDFARSVGIPCGGWCPRGRRAEDGQIPPEYPLKETWGSNYRDRTTRNVEDSDGTVVFIDGSLNEESGSALTLQLCRRLERPNLLVNLAVDTIENAAKLVREFMRDHQIQTLNVAGSRASISPSIGPKVVDVLKLAFSEEA
jgi:predicted Rossmann-fold nucleotide-binding protein